MTKKTIQVGKKGEIVIPREIATDFGLKPNESLLLREKYNYIIIERPRKMRGERIVKSLREGLKDISWKDVEKEREDRKW